MVISKSQPDHRIILDFIIAIILYNEVKCSPGAKIFLLVKISLADEQIGVVDPPDPFNPAKGHGVLLDRHGSLLNGPVHLWVELLGLLFGAEIENR